MQGTDTGLDVLLCAEHAERVAQKMADHVAVMRAEHADLAMLQGRRLRDGEALDVIRAWAVQAGYPVSKGGSVAPRIIAAYREASAAGRTSTRS